MAGLDFCSKHNMVAYLEKNDGNTEFHQIMDFLTHSSIHFALTVSPIVSTSFVEQFWTTAKSRTVNNISYIDAIVAGKPVTISEASIRSDLLFDDADGIDTLNNQAIFDTIQLMGFLQIFLRNQLRDVHVPMDHFPVPALTKKVTAQAAAIKDLKAQIKQLKKKARPVINHHKAWFRAARLKKQQKKMDMKKSKKRRRVSKQGRKAVKSSKGAQSVQTHTDWDGLDTDLEDYTLAQDKGKTDFKVEEPKTSSKTKELHVSGDTLVVEDKGSAEKGGSTKGTDLQQSTDKQNGGTNRIIVSTDSFVKGTAEIKDQVSGESDTSTVPTMTSTPTPTVFGDDETIAQVLVTMSQNKVKQKEKEKGVELKNVEDIKRPRPTSTRSLLTFKPLHKIDPKTKGNIMIEEEDESDTESEDITEAEKKFKILANDEEMARKARLNADKILAKKLQEEKREKFTIKERANLLHDTIAAQRRFLGQQRFEVIINKLPSRTQLRNQMMTYLKHVGGKKHSDLKTKIFEEIQVLYKKVKRSDENFIAIGFVEDERLIKDLNKKAVGIKNADIIKEENKEEEDTSEDDETNSEKENDELRLCLTIAPDEYKEVDYEILDKKYPIIEWKSEYLGIKPQYDETKDLEESNLSVVIRSNGQRRYFSTLIRVLSIFDREDLSAVYQLVMDRYQDEIPKDFDRVLWGDLMIMFNLSDKDEFWNSQQDWNVVSWKLHGSSGVHTSMTEARLVIHMLVEKKYPLRKKVLLQMLELKLESEEDNTMALELIRFVNKLIAELEPENSDGDEEDL
ncbi:hypothetical protein Tco_0299673 [Tanacetum coccineum]